MYLLLPPIRYIIFLPQNKLSINKRKRTQNFSSFCILRGIFYQFTFLNTLTMIIEFSFFYVLCFLAISCYSSSPDLFQVTPPTDHAEGPTWDPRTQTLLYVDIPLGKIFAYHYKNKSLFSIQLDGQVGMVIPSKSNPNRFIIGLNRTVAAIEWDGFSNSIKKYQKLVTVSEQFPTSRFNDGKADKRNRLWFGTMANEQPNGHIPPNQGILYRIDNKIATPMIAPVTISNGLAWSKNSKTFFYIDSAMFRVFQYDFNLSKGTLHNERVCFDMAWYPKLQGLPDGMTIDKDDYLWIALYGGSGVIQVNPKKGKVLRKIALPAKFVTSVMWGGPAFDILYVTTSRKDLKGREEKKKQPAAGSVFGIKNLNTSGLEMFQADVISE